MIYWWNHGHLSIMVIFLFIWWNCPVFRCYESSRNSTKPPRKTWKVCIYIFLTSDSTQKPSLPMGTRSAVKRYGPCAGGGTTNSQTTHTLFTPALRFWDLEDHFCFICTLVVRYLHSGDKISGKQAKVQNFFVGICMQEAAWTLQKAPVTYHSNKDSCKAWWRL